MPIMSKSSGTANVRSGAGYALSSDSSRALANATQTWVTAGTECQREMIGFVSMLLEKDAEITREIMGCKNSADVAEIQSRWVEETLRDYNNEMGKLITICTKSVDATNGRKGDRVGTPLSAIPSISNAGRTTIDPCGLAMRLCGPERRPPPSARTFSRGSSPRTA